MVEARISLTKKKVGMILAKDYIKIYKGFEIARCGDGLRVTRLNDDRDLHTHLQSLNACYSVIDDVLDEKLPYKRCNWYLISLIRLSTNEEYKRKIQEVIDTRKKKGKKDKYYNARKN